jgi:UDP-3-O-[3-hydroxymyristoyl] glucosamine N-acyltransferase
MEFTAAKIAELLGGEVLGNPEITVSTLSKIEEGHPGSLSFLSNPQYTPFIYKTNASIVIVNRDFVPEKPIVSTLIKVDDAYVAFAKLLEFYNTIKNNKSGIEQPSFISPSATVGEGCYIGAFAYVGEGCTIGKNVKIYPHVYVGDNVTIGDNTQLFSGVKVYAECILGSDVTIHAGTIIGGDGFGFAPNSENSYNKIAQIGNVIIEDHVEIGASTTIDRATMGSTIIRKGVKLDNLIQVAHNVEIGENTVIAAQTGIAGSTKIGKNCLIGGQVGIIGHLKIGDNVKIAAQSGIGKNVPDGQVMQGSPAFGIGDYVRSYAMFRRLPEIASKVNDLEKRKND